MIEYKVGDRDSRPWGSYEVINVGQNAAGEEVCEKIITVFPNQILSLQSHDMRREHWHVRKGVLTVILDGKNHTLRAGESIDIPLGGIHAMANLGDGECEVHEIQEGQCREEDIHRFADMYGRASETLDSSNFYETLNVYKAVLSKIHASNPDMALGTAKIS